VNRCRFHQGSPVDVHPLDGGEIIISLVLRDWWPPRTGAVLWAGVGILILEPIGESTGWFHLPLWLVWLVGAAMCGAFIIYFLHPSSR
jgi:hypothetical protein